MPNPRCHQTSKRQLKTCLSVMRTHLLHECEGKSRLFHGFREILVFNNDVADNECILRNKSLHTTRAVMDLKSCAVLLVCRRRQGVILRMEKASNGRATGTRHPKIARPATFESRARRRHLTMIPGIQDDFELHVQPISQMIIPWRSIYILSAEDHPVQCLHNTARLQSLNISTD